MNTGTEGTALIIHPDAAFINADLRDLIISRFNSNELDTAITDAITEGQAPILHIIPKASPLLKRVWDAADETRWFLLAPVIGEIMFLIEVLVDQDYKRSTKSAPTIYSKLPNGYPIAYDFNFEYEHSKLDNVDITPRLIGGESTNVPMPPKVHFEIEQPKRSRRSRRISEITMTFSNGTRDISQLEDSELEERYKHLMPNWENGSECKIIFKKTENGIPAIDFENRHNRRHVLVVFNAMENGFITPDHQPGTPVELSIDAYMKFLEIPFRVIPYARVPIQK